MAGSEDRDEWLVRVTPKRSLFRTGLWSLVATIVPLFGALLLLASDDELVSVIALLGVVVTVAGAVWIRYASTFVGVSPAEVVERGFAGRLIRTPVDRVERALIADTYRVNAPDTLPQLVLWGADGERVLRMRGTFWVPADMERVADAVGVPLERRSDPLTRAEFFAENPASEYWFDNRRWLLVAGIAVTGVAILVATLALMTMAGIPIAL